VAWPLYLGAPLTVLAASLPVLRLSGMGVAAPSGFGDLAWPLATVSVIVLLAFLAEMARYDQPGRATGSVGLATLTVVYAGLFPSFLVSLRLWGGHEWGMAALLTMIAVVKLSDTGAYFVGRALGRHKMCPRLSPGKTVEGAVGALLAGLLAALLCYYLLVPAIVGSDVPRGPVLGWLLFGLLGAVFGMIGDLAESLLKRDAQRKDSSSWLPGLGGVLDVLDSLVFVAPVAYFYFAAGVIGPR
jgi:phosphatidate cytidylyltransferase